MSHHTDGTTPAAPSTACFSTFHDDAHLRVRQLAILLGVSVATVWRWSRSGVLPAPLRLGKRVTAWNVTELRAALARRDAPANAVSIGQQLVTARRAKRADPA